MKSILKGLVVAFAALTLVGLTVPKAEAATELGTFCWQYQHASFDDGATHTLRLQVTQHDWVYSLHGHDDPWPTPVDGSAYYFSPVGRTGPTIYMGVYATYGGPSFNLWAPLNPGTLSTPDGWIEMGDGTQYSGVTVTSVQCPPVVSGAPMQK